MPDIDFTIRTRAELAGAQATAESLEMQIGKAKALGQDYSELSVQLEKAKTSIDNADPALRKSGESLDGFTWKGREMRAIVGELNRFIPELGGVLRGLGEAAQESGAAIAEGEGEVAAGAEAVQSSILPLLAILLAIKAAMEYWDMYEEKVKEVAAENDAAMKQIVDSTGKALKAAQELDELLHPKSKDLATHDEEDLKKKLKEQDASGEREKAVNKANEERELKNAASPEQRQQIQDHYRQIDQDLDEQQSLKKAKIEADAATTVAKQIADTKQSSDQQIEIQKRAYQDKKNAGDEIDRLEKSRASATKTVMGGQFGDQAMQVPDLEKNAEIDAKIAALKKVQTAADQAYADATTKQEQLKKGTGNLGQTQQDFADKSQEDVDAWSQKHDTNRAVAAVENRGEAETKLLNTSIAGANETLKSLLTETGKTHQQTEAILSGILNHTLRLGTVVQQLQGQLDQQKQKLEQVHAGQNSGT